MYNFEKHEHRQKHKLYEVSTKPCESWTLDFSNGTSVSGTSRARSKHLRIEGETRQFARRSKM